MRLTFVLSSLLAIMVACGFDKKQYNDWDYNDPGDKGFQNANYYEQETPPGMILVEGGTVVFEGSGGENWEDYPGRSIISSFYISRYHETNGQYQMYLNYLKNYYSESTYEAALPDTLFWKNIGLDHQESTFLMKNYFRHSTFIDHPVLGLNAIQIKKYAKWKTDRLNEQILIREGLLIFNRYPEDSTELFTTESYLSNQYYPKDKVDMLTDLNPNANRDGGSRIVRLEDAVLMPRLRMLTLDEYRWAASAIGNWEHTYLKTPKEIGFKKEKKDSCFIPMKVDAEKHERAATPVINRVYEAYANRYGIYGFEQVQEILCDTLGHYYQSVPADYSAELITEKGQPRGYKYRKIDFTEIDSTFSTFSGFRLAMDRIGDPSFYKSRRFK